MTEAHPEPGTFRLSAAVFAEREGQILILKRAGGELTGAWYLPGGAVDEGETPEAAAIRELREEAGLTPTSPLTLVGAVPMHVYGRNSVQLVYAAACEAGEVTISHEHDGFRWIDPREFRAQYFGDESVARLGGDRRLLAIVEGVRANLDGYIAHLDHRFEDLQLRLLGLTAEVYVVRDGKILLLKRSRGIGDGIWYIPGGVVERGEEPVAAALRETFEESGLQLAAVEHLRTWSWAAQNNRDAYHAAYIGHAPEGEVAISHEHSDWRWMTPADYLERVSPDVEAANPQFATWIRGVRRNVELAREWIERRSG